MKERPEVKKTDKEEEVIGWRKERGEGEEGRRRKGGQEEREESRSHVAEKGKRRTGVENMLQLWPINTLDICVECLELANYYYYYLHASLPPFPPPSFSPSLLLSFPCFPHTVWVNGVIFHSLG